MSTFRLRTAGGKLKIEHSIIDGLRRVLEKLLEEFPEDVRMIVPGVIKPVRDARGKLRLKVTVPTMNGWKAIAFSAGARQEIFISTDMEKGALEAALLRCLEE
ncbi:MAG: hypothetical protein IT170_06710 [Bryobacterales bacterium]|nr:hypothetical protein [Bryobacterales bacterium]MCZ2155944.1 DUF2103 domain-containing protein [Bryobacterales bacterium]